MIRLRSTSTIRSAADVGSRICGQNRCAGRALRQQSAGSSAPTSELRVLMLPDSVGRDLTECCHTVDHASTRNMADHSRNMADPEVGALDTIIKALEGLADSQRRNVLLYMNARYGGKVATSGVPRERPNGSDGHSATEAAKFASVGDLFDAVNPQSEGDRVLVVAYWKQVIEGADGFEAFGVSKELKHLGHGVANITRALGSLIDQSPKLVLQVAKSGKARQARKRYKVTREGIRKLQSMIPGEGDGDVS